MVQFDSHTEQFLVDHVGLDYFREHFTLLHEEVVESGVVKATYDYTFTPYVQHYQMTMLLDTSTWQLYDREVSRILLEPQHFEIESGQAIKIALENGLSPGESYEVNVVLDLTTNNRFAWDVISLGAGPTSEVPEPIVRVVLDVEGGEVYTIEGIEPMKSHGSP